jgi:DNA replication initiation complex subunit (GINS family)
MATSFVPTLKAEQVMNRVMRARPGKPTSQDQGPYSVNNPPQAPAKGPKPVLDQDGPEPCNLAEEYDDFHNPKITDAPRKPRAHVSRTEGPKRLDFQDSTFS